MQTSLVKSKEKTEHEPKFPIVGIGASAGGLEALEIFLKNVPPKSNTAFIIVQHLNPDHKGMMAELLQHSTEMKVIEVKDNTKVQPNSVYLIPPNKDMSMLNGVLHLLNIVKKKGISLPVDFFFKSLADDLADKSIGVILSGMGSDGTLGCKAIKEKAGVVYVQEPIDAKFDGMPKSVIEAGVADVIGKGNELPKIISSYSNKTLLLSNKILDQEEQNLPGIDKVFILLRAQTGHDFSNYKRSTINRRVERRMFIHQVDKIENYIRLLQENPIELDFLFKELLIGVTNFFRDPDIWEILKEKIIPKLISENKNTNMLRAWIPGCSTGEEAYSLAVVFSEAVENLTPKTNIKLQIFATDLNADAIDKAREGKFSLSISSDISDERLKKYFIKHETGYEITKQIREMVVFAQQNVLMDPPFTKLDIISCRNILIYFDQKVQKKLIPLFHYSLNKSAILILGNSESIGIFSNLFEPYVEKTKIFKKCETIIPNNQISFPTYFSSIEQDMKITKNQTDDVPNLQSITDQIILQKYSPAAVLVNSNGDIIYISGKTGKYLEPASGKANWNIFAMAKQGLEYELNLAFNKALRKKGIEKVDNIKIGLDENSSLIKLTVQYVSEPKTLSGMLIIVFEDIISQPQVKPLRSKKKSEKEKDYYNEIERELENAMLMNVSIKKEMQISQEELKSANEELQSTNEELQSTNEELTTSKEEMQSMNEELQTLNEEMNVKLDELSKTNNDMKNLLDSTDIATLFLDNKLNVRRFTNRTTEITNLRESDVGRPITDIASELFYPEIVVDVKKVLRTLLALEREISLKNGMWYLVRILPYRTLENMINGVVITFSDITVMKNLENELRKTQSGLENKIEKQNYELDTTKDDLRNEKLKKNK